MNAKSLVWSAVFGAGLCAALAFSVKQWKAGQTREARLSAQFSAQAKQLSQLTNALTGVEQRLSANVASMRQMPIPSTHAASSATGTNNGASGEEAADNKAADAQQDQSGQAQSGQTSDPDARVGAQQALDSALSSGHWDAQAREQFRTGLAKLDKQDLESALSQLTVAINSGKLHVDVRRSL